MALLANQVLLPAVHFATGAPLATELAMEASAGAPPPHHHHVREDGSREHSHDSTSDGGDHQVCHFCRLLGPALPTPPTTIVTRFSVSAIADWRLAHWAVRSEPYFQTGRLVRAPPSIV